MIIVWGRKTSSNVQALMWCLGELGLEYRRYDVGHRYGGTDTQQFAALNPNRTIPVIQDGDNSPLWETGCILRYLANRYGTPEFWPVELIERTEIDRWAEWSKINIAIEFTSPVFWNVVRTPDRKREAKLVNRALSRLNSSLRIAEKQFESHSFLAGEKFTLADIQFGHILYRYFTIDIDRLELPALDTYYQRLKMRPAFRKHVMVSYEELRSD